jgi:hypothetical protein
MRADLGQFLLADALDPLKVPDRPVRPALDDPPGDDLADPKERFDPNLASRVVVEGLIRSS